MQAGLKRKDSVNYRAKMGVCIAYGKRVYYVHMLAWFSDRDGVAGKCCGAPLNCAIVNAMIYDFTPAQPGQEDEIAQLLLAAFTPYVRKMGYARSGPYPWVAARIAAGEIYVVKEAADIIGVNCVRQNRDVLVIDQIGILPPYQGRGIGRFVMAETETLARRIGARKMTLFTTELMVDLLRFYASLGFVETRRALPDHGEDRFLRVHMEKQL